MFNKKIGFLAATLILLTYGFSGASLGAGMAGSPQALPQLSYLCCNFPDAQTDNFCQLPSTPLDSLVKLTTTELNDKCKKLLAFGTSGGSYSEKCVGLSDTNCKFVD